MFLCEDDLRSDSQIVYCNFGVFSKKYCFISVKITKTRKTFMTDGQNRRVKGLKG